MNLFKIIREDKDLQELKKFISDNGGFVPGFGFWDGETIDEYRERLHKIAEGVKNEKLEKKHTDRGCSKITLKEELLSINTYEEYIAKKDKFRDIPMDEEIMDHLDRNIFGTITDIINESICLDAMRVPDKSTN